jgi:hypothetical protein
VWARHHGMSSLLLTFQRESLVWGIREVGQREICDIGDGFVAAGNPSTGQLRRYGTVWPMPNTGHACRDVSTHGFTQRHTPVGEQRLLAARQHHLPILIGAFSAGATMSRICACDLGSSPSIATKTGRISVWKSGIGTKSNTSYQQRQRLPLARCTPVAAAITMKRLDADNSKACRAPKSVEVVVLRNNGQAPRCGDRCDP